MKICELCTEEISVFSRFCPEHAAERRKEKDRNRKRQERLDGKTYASVKSSQDRQREIKRRWICEYLLQNPCIDCGESDILVLEFDHRGEEEKRKDISIMISSTYSLKSVIREVSKCDVRCANCHKRMTYKRFGETYRTRFIASLSIGSLS